MGALLLFVSAAACTPATPRGSTLAPTPHGSAWVVEPGDMIRLKNWGAPEQSGDLIVNERGSVLIPTVGQIAVAGITTDSLERQVVRAFSGRVDASRVDVQLVDAPTSVLSLVAKSGGAIRPGADSRVYVVRPGQPSREVSVADRIGDLGIRASDQLYVQDPPFTVRNELAIRSAYELVQFSATLLTIYYLIRRN